MERAGIETPWNTLILLAVSGTRKTMMLKQSVLAIFSVDHLLLSWGGNQDCVDGKANQLLHPIHSLRSTATTISILDPPEAQRASETSVSSKTRRELCT